MRAALRRCLKCDKPVSAGRWLCPACRQANRIFAGEAEGVVDLYDVDY